MAENRFAKSIQAAKERTVEAEVTKKEQEADRPVIKESSKKQTGEKIQPVKDFDVKLDIDKILSDASKKTRSSAKTFYMTEDNMEKLEKLAKLQKISISKVLNEILNNVL